jgi:hypothetical protein
MRVGEPFRFLQTSCHGRSVAFRTVEAEMYRIEQGVDYRRALATIHRLTVLR